MMLKLYKGSNTWETRVLARVHAGTHVKHEAKIGFSFSLSSKLSWMLI